MKPLRAAKPTAFTLIEIMIVVLIIAVLLAIAVPNFLQARDTSRAKSCVANLKQIDSAKQQYMMENNTEIFASVTSGADTTIGGLVGRYIKNQPLCRAGGSYTSGDGLTRPTCSVAGTGGADPTYGQNGLFPHYLP